jgi:drug/metabolite transporter (DMT)-like permease
VTAILGGVGAALCWAAATLCSSRSSRAIGAPSVLAWVMLIGFVAVLPFAVSAGVPPQGSALGWLAVLGLANVVGLLLEYTGLRRGKVGVVVAITSTEGAFAAILAAIFGEPVPAATAVALAVIATGVVLAALEPGAPVPGRETKRAVPLAIGAAVSFGIGLYAAGRVSGEFPLAWVLIPARAFGVALLVVPLAATRRLKITRRVVPLVVAAGLLEVVGFVSFVLGARHGIAITSVLGSQFAALATFGAFVLFGERLHRIQIAGIAAILVGVASLTLLRA